MVKIETMQPSAFKSLFNILKENNILEANLTISETGIEILEMDSNHIVIAHVLLNMVSNFDSFYCKEPVLIGVDVTNLTKILKGIGSKEMLTLFAEDPTKQVESSDGDASVKFGLLIENANKGQSSKIFVDTIDVNKATLEVPYLDYPYQIQMPSSDLQSIVGNLKNMSGETVKITLHKEVLKFYTKGDNGTLETVRCRTNKEDNSIKITSVGSDGGSTIIELYVKLNNLIEFTKCTSLANMVTMYLQNDAPVFLEYDVGNLGFIRLGASTLKNKPENW